MQKINLQEPQGNRNANANFVNLIRTSTVNTQNIVKSWRFKAASELGLHYFLGDISLLWR